MPSGFVSMRYSLHIPLSACTPMGNLASQSQSLSDITNTSLIWDQKNLKILRKVKRHIFKLSLSMCIGVSVVRANKVREMSDASVTLYTYASTCTNTYTCRVSQSDEAMQRKYTWRQLFSTHIKSCLRRDLKLCHTAHAYYCHKCAAQATSTFG